jgi:hypothetical protein
MKKSSKYFLDEIDKFSKGKLKKKEDLERLLEISINNNKGEILEETAFIAKYLQGLFGIIQKGETAVDDEVLNKYVKEYTENIEKLKDKIRLLLQDSSSFFKNIFEEKYFTLTQDSINNLNDLCYDLSWIKMFLNDQKIKL